MVDKERLLQIIYDLSELENNMKWSSQKSILFQVEVIKLCSKINTVKYVESVDNSVQNSANPANTQVKSQSFPQSGVEKTQIRPVQNKPIAKMNTIEGSKIQNWGKIVGDLKQTGKILLYTNLMNTNAVEINDMTVGINFPNGITPFAKSVLDKPENMQEITKLVSMQCGKSMRVQMIDGTKNNIVEKEKTEPIADMANDLDIPINIIDG